jgi:hypothetical protein
LQPKISIFCFLTNRKRSTNTSTSWVTKTLDANVNEPLHATKDVTNIRHRVTIGQETTGVTNVHLRRVTNGVIVMGEAKTVTINAAIAPENEKGHAREKTNDVTVQDHVMKSVVTVQDHGMKSVAIDQDHGMKNVAIVLDRAIVTIITNEIIGTKITKMNFVITQNTGKRARNTSK